MPPGRKSHAQPDSRCSGHPAPSLDFGQVDHKRLLGNGVSHISYVRSDNTAAEDRSSEVHTVRSGAGAASTWSKYGPEQEQT